MQYLLHLASYVVHRVCLFLGRGTYAWHCVCLFFVGLTLGIGFVCWLGHLCLEMVVLFGTRTADELFLEYLVVLKRTGYCSSTDILPSC